MSDIEKTKRTSVTNTKISDGEKKKKKISVKSEVLTEDDDDDTKELERILVDGQSEGSTERRSSRIMTRRQRDSELRLSFAKKLKATNNVTASRTPVRYSDLTSDSETPTTTKAKKPLLGKRKLVSQAYFEQKRARRDVDTTTTDDNDDTEESDHKPTPNVKRKPKVKPTNEDSESDSARRKVISKPNRVSKVIDISDGDDRGGTGRVKKKPQNAKVAKLVRKMKSDFSDETDTDSQEDLEADLQKAIAAKFPSYKNPQRLNSVGNSNVRSSLKPPLTASVGNFNSLKPPMTAIRKPVAGQRKSEMVRANYSISTNGKAVKMFTKPYVARKPAAPRLKSDFDKLVDELFEEDATRVRKAPQFMMINNEPTDVYTLSIDDTLEEEDELEHLGALCEEVEEDVIEEVSKPVNVAPKPLDQPARGPLHLNALKKQIYKPEPHAARPPEAKTKTLVLPRTPVNSITARPPPSLARPLTSPLISSPVKSSPLSSPPMKPVVETNIDYKEKYNKLHTSYETLSKKIAQYMEKTSKEKDALRRQIRIEKSKCNAAQEDLDIMKRKCQYLIKNRQRKS